MADVVARSTLHTISKGRSARGRCNGGDVLTRFVSFPLIFLGNVEVADPNPLPFQVD
jgi:hypothetical protein